MEKRFLLSDEKGDSRSNKNPARSPVEDDSPPPTIEYLMRDPNVTGETPSTAPPPLLAATRTRLSSIISNTERSLSDSAKQFSKASTFRDSIVAKLIRPITSSKIDDKPVFSFNVVDTSETGSVISERPSTFTPQAPVASSSTTTVQPRTLRKQVSSDSSTSWVSTSKSLKWPLPPSFDSDNPEPPSASIYCPTPHAPSWHPAFTAADPSGSSSSPSHSLELGSEEGDKEHAWTRALRTRMTTPVSNMMKASLKRRESATSFISRDARPKTMAVEFAKDLGLLPFPCTLDELDSSQREIASGGIPELHCSALFFTRSCSAVDLSSPSLSSEHLTTRPSVEQLQFVHLVLSTYAVANPAEPLALRTTTVALHAFPAPTLEEGAAKQCTELRRLRVTSSTNVQKALTATPGETTDDAQVKFVLTVTGIGMVKGRTEREESWLVILTSRRERDSWYRVLKGAVADVRKMEKSRSLHP
ncbi:BQ2448_7564 [Microbotryum intermedium]|uniref:BQ2448_7564 protein n=1 Tax=Microbotryum intermedium TaxID=269621 RepID=A0A238FMZ4_9BASI|nr:BQ2448_7564 [Microbotryum intermedium]